MLRQRGRFLGLFLCSGSRSLAGVTPLLLVVIGFLSFRAVENLPILIPDGMVRCDARKKKNNLFCQRGTYRVMCASGSDPVMKKGVYYDIIRTSS